MANQEPNAPWHDSGYDSLASARCLYELAERFTQVHTVRRWEACELYRMYRGNTIGRRADCEDASGLGGYEPIATSETPQTLNIAKDLVDTLVAKLTSGQNPKPQVVVTEGPWETRRRARLVDRFIEGQFQERQGKHRDLWAVFEHAYRIAIAATRTAAVKFYSDPERGKVCAEIHDTLSMIMDTTASVYDEPTWLGEVQYVDPHRLARLYPSEKANILAAAEPTTGRDQFVGLEQVDDDYNLTSTTDVFRVKVIEGWHYAVGDTKGRHVVAINGACLLDEEYEFEDSPFVFVGGVRQLTGPWHQTLIRAVAPSICRVNELLEEIDESEYLTPKKIRYYDPEVHKKEDLQTTEDVEIVPIPGLANGVAPPVDSTPNIFNPQMLELVNFYISKSYGNAGINEFNTAGQIKGEWSGAALRLMKDQLVERFAPEQRDFLHVSVVEAAQKIARVAKQVAEDSDGKFSSSWKGDLLMSDIDVDVLSLLDEEKYSVDVYSVGEQKNTPEDRIQLYEDLAKTGVMSGDTALSVVQYYDTIGDAESDEAQRKYIEKQIDRWLYAEADEVNEPGFYRGPLKSMDHAKAIVQVNKAYISAVTDEVDAFRTDMFAKFIQQSEKGMLAQAEMRAKLAPPPEAAAPAAPPMAPTGPPVV